MSNFLEKQNCSIHNQGCVAVCVAESADTNNLLLCIKCMADKLSFSESVLLNDEAVTILNEIKYKEYESQKSSIEQSLDKYRICIQKIQDYMDWQNGCLNKIIIQLNSEIEKLSNELNQLKEPKSEDLESSDVQVLHQSLNQQNLINKQQFSNNNQQRTEEYFIQVEKQLQSITSDDKFQQIFDYINKIIHENVKVEKSIDQKIENQYDSTKTPFLKHLCSIHGKEIIMFTLDEDFQGERVLCVDCIPKFKNEVITLEDANKLWMMCQGSLFDNQNKFLIEREQKYLQLQKIIQENEGKFLKLQNEIKQLIETQNKDIAHQIKDQQMQNIKQSLMQLELKELKLTLNQLSQKDKLNQLQQEQYKLIEDDQLFEKEILKKQSEIQQLQKCCMQKLQKLFDFNDTSKQEYQIQIESFQKEIENQKLDSSLFTNLIPKFQNELQQSLLVIMKEISDKGHQYIQQLNNNEFQIKNKEQEQMNINLYQDTLSKFDRQFKIMTNEINLEVASPFQTKNNFKVDSQIINITQQIGKFRQLSINTIKTMQFKSKINNLRFQDQLIQTNKYLNINQQIIAVSTKILQQTTISTNQQQQINFSNILNYTKLLKFSTNLKHSNITISADGKTAKSTSGGWYLCLCDQPIPKDGTVVVDFKVKQLQHLLAGVCLINSINKEYGDLLGIGQGCYFSYDNGYIYSHHDKYKDNKNLGFPFYQNDIISMEVNVQQKQITWRNKAKNQVYTLEIQTTSDLYYCFELRGQTEIELL